MERHRRPGDRQDGGELADGAGPLGQQLDDGSAGAVAEGGECGPVAVQNVSSH
jgi:hypothetical protein